MLDERICNEMYEFAMILIKLYSSTNLNWFKVTVIKIAVYKEWCCPKTKNEILNIVLRTDFGYTTWCYVNMLNLLK